MLVLFDAWRFHCNTARALIEVRLHMQGRLQHRPDDLTAGLQETPKRICRQQTTVETSEEQTRQAWACLLPAMGGKAMTALSSGRQIKKAQMAPSQSEPE